MLAYEIANSVVQRFVTEVPQKQHERLSSSGQHPSERDQKRAAREQIQRRLGITAAPELCRYGEAREVHGAAYPAHEPKEEQAITDGSGLPSARNRSEGEQ